MATGTVYQIINCMKSCLSTETARSSAPAVHVYLSCHLTCEMSMLEFSGAMGTAKHSIYAFRKPTDA